MVIHQKTLLPPIDQPVCIVCVYVYRFYMCTEEDKVSILSVKITIYTIVHSKLKCYISFV